MWWKECVCAISSSQEDITYTYPQGIFCFYVLPSLGSGRSGGTRLQAHTNSSMLCMPGGYTECWRFLPQFLLVGPCVHITCCPIFACITCWKQLLFHKGVDVGKVCCMRKKEPRLNSLSDCQIILTQKMLICKSALLIFVPH